jgi:hypothetical protein
MEERARKAGRVRLADHSGALMRLLVLNGGTSTVKAAITEVEGGQVGAFGDAKKLPRILDEVVRTRGRQRRRPTPRFPVR